MKTFFYLTDLSDEFTENFSIDQIIRYGKVIDFIKKGAQINESFEEYEVILKQIKVTMIQFITNMDISEVYQFVNLFPFLIDPDEL